MDYENGKVDVACMCSDLYGNVTDTIVLDNEKSYMVEKYIKMFNAIKGRTYITKTNFFKYYINIL